MHGMVHLNQAEGWTVPSMVAHLARTKTRRLMSGRRRTWRYDLRVWREYVFDAMMMMKMKDRALGMLDREREEVTSFLDDVCPNSSGLNRRRVWGMKTSPLPMIVLDKEAGRVVMMIVVPILAN
jgi:hypothetical protein